MSDNRKDPGRLVVPVGLGVVVVLVVATLVVSIYETVIASSGDQAILKNPEVVAIAVGLLLSVLFVERWRSVEGRLDKLSDEEQARLKDLETYAKTRTKQIVGETVDKADKLSAKLAAIAEDNPWLEVITKRDIIVETESIRGILRTSYTLLHDEKYLHLYEYLEYCARKGTAQDSRDSKRRLRGTPEDFLEIASFCEVWLEDYALSTEFLQRYVEGAGDGGYTLTPELIVRLLRMGKFPEAATKAATLERLLRRDEWHKRIPFIAVNSPISGRLRWRTWNVLSLTYAVFDDDRRSQHYATVARNDPYATLFAADQRLFEAEVAVNCGDFEGALTDLLPPDGSDDDADVSYLHQLIFIYERMNRFDLAAPLRARLEKYRAQVQGDTPLPSSFRGFEPPQNEHGPTFGPTSPGNGRGPVPGGPGDQGPGRPNGDDGPDEGHGRSI
jgi:hypothetical protein